MLYEFVFVGNIDEDNEVFKVWSEDLLQLLESVCLYWELVKEYNFFDLELGVKIIGFGFLLYCGKGVCLQCVLIVFFLDEVIVVGYEEVILLYMVNEVFVYGIG